MDKANVRKEFERQWGPWTATLGDIPVSVSREPGVCGFWTAHDVVGHVQAYVRYHLVQVRAAFSHVEPTVGEVMGDRGEMRQVGGSLDARNEGLRTAGLSLEWQQLLDEAEWLRAETLTWIDSLTSEELDEPVGWVEFWKHDATPPPDNLRLHVRRLGEAPAAFAAMPAWQFVLPDKPPDHHVTEHLGQLRARVHT